MTKVAERSSFSACVIVSSVSRSQPLIATVLTAVWTASALSSQTRHQQSNGTLRGELELCGGPNVGGRHCRIVTGKWTGCTDHVCRSLDEIVVRTPSDKTVAEAGVRRGRFAVRLKPGRYLVLLLWTSTHHRPSVALKATCGSSRRSHDHVPVQGLRRFRAASLAPAESARASSRSATNPVIGGNCRPGDCFARAIIV